MRTGKNVYTEDLFHPVNWNSQKQKRVSYYAFCAKIMAAADAYDRGFDSKYRLQKTVAHTRNDFEASEL